MDILIAEDDFSSRFLMQEFLKPYGNCVVAVNGREAVELFIRSLDYGPALDLVCLDIMMPEMNGQDALKEIRKIEHGRGIGGKDMVKIIMVTALEDAQNVMQAFLRGACEGYLIKPLSRKSLDDKLTELGFKQKN